jgi:RNA polymerase sigma-70 factor (ECF subfamily)
MRRAFYLSLGIVGNVEDARDLAQEAFVKAFLNRRNLKAGKPFLPWFYGILRNLCIDWIRSPAWRGADIDTVPFDLVENDVDFESDLEREELKSHVWKAIQRLKPEHREIIVLRHFEELSYEVLSGVLGIPRGTVMSRLYHARSELKRYLRPYFEREERG